MQHKAQRAVVAAHDAGQVEHIVHLPHQCRWHLHTSTLFRVAAYPRIIVVTNYCRDILPLPLLHAPIVSYERRADSLHIARGAGLH